MAKILVVEDESDLNKINNIESPKIEACNRFYDKCV